MRNKLLQVYSWSCTLVSCCYFGWTYWRLNYATKAFGDLYGSLNADLPLVTRFVISQHEWLYPMLFLGAGVVIVVKEVLLRNKKISLVITSMAAFGVLFAADLFVRALYEPAFTLGEKLSR